MPEPRIDRLRHQGPVILPSMLLCNFGNLEAEVRSLEEAGTRAYHLDVMDGRFVDNLTYGMPIVAAMRQLTELPLDVHLMIEEPERYITSFCESGADLLTVHVEACADPSAALQAIRDHGVAAGLAINPDTEIGQLEAHLPHCDAVLIMSVPPGVGGQSFVPATFDRLRWVRERVADTVMLGVDGGVKLGNIGECAAAGAELLVVGSAIFNEADYGQALSELKGAFANY